MLARALQRWSRDEVDAVRYAVTVIRQHNLTAIVDALPPPFAERVRAAIAEFARPRQVSRREMQERERKAAERRLQEQQREERALRLTALRAGITELEGEARIRFLAGLAPSERNLIVASPAERREAIALRKTALLADKVRREAAKQCIGTIALRERGWTAAQITRLLGAPDMTRTNPHGRDLSPMKLYNRDRVAEVERSAAFTEWYENAKRRTQGSLVESTAENILAAVFAVNRAAKRRRDAASTAYSAEMYGFAGHHSSEKRGLYELKDKGIAHLASEGVLACIGIHGRLAMWKGSGYTFHSTLHPLPLPQVIDGDLFLAEAKPRGSRRREPRIKDARLLLESLGDRNSKFGRLNDISYANARRPRVRFKRDFIEEEDFEEDFIDEDLDDFIEEEV
jgi:hypothetical protein